VRELFERLLGDGKRIVLASSAKGDELEAYKEIAGIKDLIQDETSADDVERSKPHPDIFQVALKRLAEISAQEVFVVGDTPYDAEAASKIHLRTIGFLSGGFPEAALRQAGCIKIYQGAADLLADYEDSPIAQRSFVSSQKH
jgi:phosphoglycolate phosphatase-like HAD superfamily hydrolase